MNGNGRRVPLDAEPIEAVEDRHAVGHNGKALGWRRELVLHRSGPGGIETFPGWTGAPRDLQHSAGHRSHFATCPDAAQHRKQS